MTVHTCAARSASKCRVQRRVGLTLGLAFSLTLSSCGGALDSSSLVSAAQGACTRISPILSAAAFVPDPRVQSIVGFANAMCGPLSRGSVPSTLDGNTSTWLGSLEGMLRVLVPVVRS